MKKFLSLALAVVMIFGAVAAFSSCSKESDAKMIEERGYFYCGITVYEPMNYYDEEGNLTGFDTEFAQAVAKKLGLEVKFVPISWPNKYVELNSGAIDCIWNGFTYGMEGDVSRTDYVDFTYSYLENRQCVVTLTTRLAELATKEAFAGKTGAAEGGSSGQAVAEELAGEGVEITTFTSQLDALKEVLSGNADFAVIDYQMAKAYAGVGDYASISINTAHEPESEVYAIGLRKGSDFTAKINEAIKALEADGTLKTLAEKYDLENDLIKNIGSES